MSAAEPVALTGVVSARAAECGVPAETVPADDPPAPVPEPLSATLEEMLEDGFADAFADTVDAELVDGFEAADSHDERIAIRRRALNRML
ncbi:MAG: hypothetical protein M3Z30_09320 [Gemmatimonadota bacterium]|nr:hypothetical protein [Gemmatimonadota bacterium]